MELTLNFEKTFISKSIGIVLQENLPPNEVEALNRILQGKKAQYQDANSLLYSILRVIENKGGEEESEFSFTNRKDLEHSSSQESSQPDPLGQLGQSQITQPQKDVATPSASSNNSGGENSNPGTKMPNRTNQNKKKELCRFYGRGQCNRSKECRFDHPVICKKFKLYGSKSTDPKGCDGKCSAFHPNACRSSLLSKTCPFNECRFYHLKGTKRSNFDHTHNKGQSWSVSKQSNDQARGGPRLNKPHRNNQPDQRGSRQESKNWRRQCPDQNLDHQIGNASREDPVTRSEEKMQLTQTLDAIMKRLTVMEMRQPVFLHPAMNLQPPTQPLMSPAVPLPSSQTQHQWASPNQWTQTQF